MTRTLTLALAASLSFALTTPADAVRGGSNEPPLVTAGRAQRLHRVLVPTQLGSWTALVDRDTDVPLRMWGKSDAIAGVVANPAIAEAAARAFLAQHITTLAPGATAADFVLVSNRVDNGIRSVGFAQRAGGLVVVGGSIGFAFQADRLALVSSTALPHIAAPAPTAPISRTSALTAARSWLGRSGYAITSRDPASAIAAPPVIVPVIRPRTSRGIDITYRVAHELSVEDTAQHQRWAVWVDAATGAPIARKSTVARGVGTVLYQVPNRGPQGTRSALPAIFATVSANGVPITSRNDGGVSFDGTGPVSLALGLSGPFVAVSDFNGNNFTETRSLADGGTVTFAHPTEEAIDAQLAAFVHANEVKLLAKRIDPDLAYLDQTLSVSVNEGDVCNAFSTGDDIHFFAAGDLDTGVEVLHCENTGRIADVVYHEFGHSWHFNTSIPGIGQFHPSVSEGLADFTSSLITNDHGLAPGFFTDKPDQPLRDLDPVGIEKRFPDDADGEPHNEGEIIGEALFDLRKALEAKLGASAGRAQIEKIFLGIMKRSVDLPSTYAEALLADDTDGDLTNGTPNKCDIDAAFAIHGLADPATTLGIVPPTREGFTISATLVPPVNSCGGALPTVTGVTVDWNLRGGPVQQVALAQSGQTFSGAIPEQAAGSVVQYKVSYQLSNGSTVSFPSGNPAEPYLEFYVGTVRPIACFDFEGGAQGWTGDAQWRAGTPLGLGGDPDVAHAGTGVFGLDIDEDGVYLPDTVSSAQSPAIDLKGAKKVRLQYHRWLGVEDGLFDRARILVNGTEVWTNAASTDGFTLKSHTDHEWRFSDLDLSQHVATGSIQLTFEITSDSFAEFGGWTLDDVCLVEEVASACGNGVVDQGETCDDGNAVAGDGCSATCTIEDEVPPADDGGGCCSTSGSPVAPAGFSALLGLGLLRRRRRVRGPRAAA